MSYIQGMVLNKRFWSQKSKLYPVLNKIIIQQFFTSLPWADTGILSEWLQSQLCTQTHVHFINKTGISPRNINDQEKRQLKQWAFVSLGD